MLKPGFFKGEFWKTRVFVLPGNFEKPGEFWKTRVFQKPEFFVVSGEFWKTRGILENLGFLLTYHRYKKGKAIINCTLSF